MAKIEIRIKLSSNMFSKTIEIQDTDDIISAEDDITTAVSELLFGNATIERILIPEGINGESEQWIKKFIYLTLKKVKYSTNAR